MKKSMIALMLCIVSIMVMSQEQIGSYTMGYFDGKEYKIQASAPKNGKFDFYIDVEGERKSDNVNLLLENTELEKFKTVFTQVRDKYLEWAKTAKANNVTDINKDFPWSFPKLSVAWYGSKWWFSFNRYFTPRFMVFKDGTSAMVLSAKVVSSSNEYIDQKFYLVLQTEEEFNQILDVLNEEKVINYFKNKENTKDLFK